MDLKAAYQRAPFARYLQDEFLSDDFIPADEEVGIGTKGKLRSARLLGTSPSLRLKILEFSHESGSDPRVSLSRESFRIMREYNYENALAVFRSGNSDNWRLSLITTDLEYDEERNRVKREFSNPRRCSFFLGPGAKTTTARIMLQKQGRVADKAELQKRFSLEVVNKEFYSSIASSFSRLAGGTRMEGSQEIEYAGLIKLPGTDDRNLKQEFAVRLIGRLVFCWFLREKGLIGTELLSSDSVRATKGFYHRTIEPLFFQVLNTPHSDRRSAFKTRLYAALPFLNGGLFSPHLHDFYDYDPATEISANLNTLKIPDDWLEDFIGVLENYNFTVDENTSVDIDLSIDPEMLGRIFENLLAEINPETGDTARRQTGSFYTPRGIVDYMVTESLRSYLLCALWPEVLGRERDERLARLAELFSYETEELHFSPAEQGKLIDAFHAMKCLDPACGSGAFPMGLLQKTLLALERLDPKGERWLQKQLEGIPDATLRTQAEDSLKAKNYDYIHKLGIIQNCIYGIDIQPIAVEISKLRAFLSLIVEEEVDEAKPNRGIEALPNLEFKFVCADSLIGLPKAEHLSYGFDYNEKTIRELEEERSRYLSASGRGKEKIKERYAELQRILFSMAEWADKKTSKSFALSTWDPFADEASTWFDPFWMFGLQEEKGGFFDIVIANPPYIGFQGISKNKKDLLKSYQSTKGKYDYYVPFVELGINLLKEEGQLAYICQSAFMQRDYGKSLRRFILQSTIIQEIIDFRHEQLFDNATNYTAIIRFAKKTNSDYRFPFRNSLKESPILIEVKNLEPDGWVLTKDDGNAVIDKMRILSLKLGDIADISEGIVTGSNSTHIIEKSSVFMKKTVPFFKPCLRGSQIGKYKIDGDFSEYIFYPYTTVQGKTKIIEEDAIEQYSPDYYEYLLVNKTKLGKRGYFQKSKKKWYELWNQRNMNLFESKKIVTPEMSDTNRFAFAGKGIYFGDSVCGIRIKPEYAGIISLECLLGILNSRLIEYVYKRITVPKHGGYYIYKVMFLAKIPIPSLSEKDKAISDIGVLVEKVCKKKQDCEDTADLECKIDSIVESLYDLTEDEIAFVEASVNHGQ